MQANFKSFLLFYSILLMSNLSTSVIFWKTSEIPALMLISAPIALVLAYTQKRGYLI